MSVAVCADVGAEAGDGIRRGNGEVSAGGEIRLAAEGKLRRLVAVVQRQVRVEGAAAGLEQRGTEIEGRLGIGAARGARLKRQEQEHHKYGKDSPQVRFLQGS